MMLSRNLDEIFSEENVNMAIDFLLSKKDAMGDDGVRLHELKEYWMLNKEILLSTIKEGTYKPQIIHEKIIVQANGKHRKISLFSSVDRLILRVLQQSLQPVVDEESSRYSFAYQTGKGIIEAAKCAASFIESGKEYVIELDIKDFFECINHDILFLFLKARLKMKKCIS